MGGGGILLAGKTYRVELVQHFLNSGRDFMRVHFGGCRLEICMHADKGTVLDPFVFSVEERA